MLTIQPTEPTFPGAWPEMLRKMEETLQRLLPGGERDSSLPIAAGAAPEVAANPKQIRLLQRLDKHLGNLEACMERAEKVAWEGGSALDEAIVDVERWLQAVREVEKKLATSVGNPVG
jgi:hypothetical protein